MRDTEMRAMGYAKGSGGVRVQVSILPPRSIIPSPPHMCNPPELAPSAGRTKATPRTCGLPYGHSPIVNAPTSASAGYETCSPKAGAQRTRTRGGGIGGASREIDWRQRELARSDTSNKGAFHVLKKETW